MTPYYEHNGITIYHGDCLAVMPMLSGPVDLILADLPYGTTACAWDSVIPLDQLWAQYRRLIKPAGAVVLTGSQPFTTTLISSNLAWFRYSWVWDKRLVGNPFLAKYQPLKVHEDICVFSKGGYTYNPQMRTGMLRKKGGGYSKLFDVEHATSNSNEYYPVSILEVSNAVRGEHPTQKPQALMEYLILTYSNPGDVVLDNTMGSGTTLAAAKKLSRRAIGIEQDAEYCDVAIERLQQEVLPLAV